MSEVLLFALTGEGPRPIAPAPGASGLHDAFDHVPEGVYSGLRTYGRVNFLRLDLHMARTHRSTRALGWEDFDEAALRRALDACARAAPFAEMRVRFDVLERPAALEVGAARMLIGLQELTPVPEELLREGVRVGVARELHRETPLVKTTDFVRRRRPFERRLPGVYECVMLDEAGRVLEGLTSNFFGVEGRVLRTAGAGVLEGVTRAILLELAAGLELELRLEPIPLADCPRLDEAFVSSSSRGLVPVVEVDGLRVGGGRPGPVASRLLAAYASYAEREARPALPWP